MYAFSVLQVVDARAGPSLKTTLKPKKMKTLSGSRIKSNQISKLQKEFKRHSKNQCGKPSASLLAISFRQKVCCGIIYKGRFGEVLIDTHLFKPCCSNKKSATEKPEQEGPQSPAISTQEEW
ncbi:UNVERIFIED_CONTAM: hypothetical protein H355_004265 [Colinus virginianus]|nr:hypothetical protein H355_004265 [Colinus virginianus]